LIAPSSIPSSPNTAVCDSAPSMSAARRMCSGATDPAPQCLSVCHLKQPRGQRRVRDVLLGIALWASNLRHQATDGIGRDAGAKEDPSGRSRFVVAEASQKLIGSNFARACAPCFAFGPGDHAECRTAPMISHHEDSRREDPILRVILGAAALGSVQVTRSILAACAWRSFVDRPSDALQMSAREGSTDSRRARVGCCFSIHAILAASRRSSVGRLI
jgi:hypothetical protein